MEEQIVEANMDTLVGPTHHYSGLGIGNIASMEHRHLPSSPRRAALEGLNKAWLVAQQGVPQFVLPPSLRPRLDYLSKFGFHGTPAEQLRAAVDSDPALLSAVYSSSFMWTANAATVTPASDSWDGKVHLTIANLSSSLHRSLEAEERYHQLRFLFDRVQASVIVHTPLPASVPLRDEGAANHLRLAGHSRTVGLNIFVHGDPPSTGIQPIRFMPRHTLAASQMIERLHRLEPRHTFHLQQLPEAISAGVFHNDVIATSHDNLLIFHERAFVDGWQSTLQEVEAKLLSVSGSPLISVMVKESELGLHEAVRSYLFNSQLISPRRSPEIGRGGLVPGFAGEPGLPRVLLIAPRQCQEVAAAERLINTWIQSPEIPIDQVMYVELRQSMAGGGGPACLRLRLPISPSVLADLPTSCRLNQSLFEQLSRAIERYYPESLTVAELADYEFAESAMRTATIVSGILGFPT